MSDQTADAVAEEELTATPKKGMSGKKLVLFIVLPILLLGGGAAGAYFAGLLDPLLGKEAPADADAEAAAEEEQGSAPKEAAYFDLPDLLVNLDGDGRRSSFLKLSISLELKSEQEINNIQAVMPRIIDNFQVYLRELRPEDLRGSAGLQRLREELLLRVNAATQHSAVKDVLFKEMLIQ